jgi:nitrite reductase/ring-hydroxylating ferredoxin subunit
MSWQDLSSAPAIGTVLCHRDAVKGALPYSVETEKGTFPIILVETDAGIAAYVNACPHQYLPLDYRSPKILSADGRKLICSGHGALFDIETGEGLSGDGLGCTLDQVPVSLDPDGMIRIG